MLRKLRRKLAAAVAVVLVGGASGVAAYAQGNTFSAVLDVAPGERRCIDHPTQAFRNASVYDYVMSGAMVKFIFLSGSREISSSGYPVLSYYDYLEARPSSPPSFIPDFFPGFFRTCARNDSYQPSTVYLSLTVDQ